MSIPVLTASEITEQLAIAYPQEFNAAGVLSVLDVGHHAATVKLVVNQAMLRPGGTVSGPTLMKLADIAMYVALLGAIGWQPLAVTTNFSINFLRKPTEQPLIAACRLLKLGKRLAVGDIAIRSEGVEALVAHATATYSIPA